MRASASWRGLHHDISTPSYRPSPARSVRFFGVDIFAIQRVSLVTIILRERDRQRRFVAVSCRVRERNVTLLGAGAFAVFLFIRPHGANAPESAATAGDARISSNWIPVGGMSQQLVARRKGSFTWSGPIGKAGRPRSRWCWH